MLPDEAKTRDTCSWLSKARTDLRSALHAKAGSLPEDAVFHCQQCAEKAIEAFLTWHDVPFRRTHSLEELGRQCTRIDPTLEPIVDRAVPLTEYAWAFRYPGEQEEPTPEDTDEALATAAAVMDAVLQRIPVDFDRP